MANGGDKGHHVEKKATRKESATQSKKGAIAGVRRRRPQPKNRLSNPGSLPGVSHPRSRVCPTRRTVGWSRSLRLSLCVGHVYRRVLVQFIKLQNDGIGIAAGTPRNEDSWSCRSSRPNQEFPVDLHGVATLHDAACQCL